MITEEAKKRCSVLRRSGRSVDGFWTGSGTYSPPFLLRRHGGTPPWDSEGGDDANVYIKSTPSSLPLSLGAAMRWVGERATTRGGRRRERGCNALAHGNMAKRQEDKPTRTNERTNAAATLGREGGGEEVIRQSTEFDKRWDLTGLAEIPKNDAD